MSLFLEVPLLGKLHTELKETVNGNIGAERIWFIFRVPLLCQASLCCDRLVGLVVKASASRADDPGFESHLRL